MLFCGKYMTDCRGQFPASWFAHATLEDAAWGAAREVKPKFVSRSDPAAKWTGALKGHAFFAYATNYLIDFDHAVIINVEVCRAIRQAEVGASRTMRISVRTVLPVLCRSAGRALVCLRTTSRSRSLNVTLRCSLRTGAAAVDRPEYGRTATIL